MTINNFSTHFLNTFRHSAPYIHAHRHSTFVIYFGGEAVLDTKNIKHLIHDFSILNSLGIRLILVHGLRPQIDIAMQQQNLSYHFHQQQRITDKKALQCVKHSAGQVRIEIESLLSLGIANSPMAGADIRVISGNFITAQPQGIINGIDYQYTGKVRRIDKLALTQQLDLGNIVLISPIGYSPSGDLFNLSAEQVATDISISLQTEKLILMTEQNCVKNHKIIREMTSKEAQHFIINEPLLELSTQCAINSAIQGCHAGVKRVHLLNRKIDGALLIELFSHDGIGTLISSEQFERLRPANLQDIQGILELIKPLATKGLLIPRSQENIELNIKDYHIIERDGLIIACTALHKIAHSLAGLIACLAVHPDYQKSSRGQQLLNQILKSAKQQKLQQLFALSTQTMAWFKEKNFKESHFHQLPLSLQTQYNHIRKAKVLSYDL